MFPSYQKAEATLMTPMGSLPSAEPIAQSTLAQLITSQRRRVAMLRTTGGSLSLSSRMARRPLRRLPQVLSIPAPP